MNKLRVFVERKEGFDIERNHLILEIKQNFEVSLKSLRYLLCYDIFDIEDDILEETLPFIFYEPNKDKLTYKLDLSRNYIAIEYLPGQFDQRADSALQCIKLINPKEAPIVKSGIVIIFDEEISLKKINAIKKYLINEVDSREKDLSILEKDDVKTTSTIPQIKGFTSMNTNELKALHSEFGLAMAFEDLVFINEYFSNEENRDPYETEIKVLDTYWSDHCRHTTFETEIEEVVFLEDEFSLEIQKSYSKYKAMRKYLNRENKPITLMDIATINSRYEYKKGNLSDLEISDEVNAASIYINVDVDGVDEKWLLMFKNETHNHPTEIEPFGGASTCIGGAIRDPLSGRSYVYAAMRITGAADITENLADTIKGKLPQKVISKVAALGYSSYGNQIGLATTFVNEIYHKGYVAKRMEIGAVMGAVKASNVMRGKPIPGDIIIMLGGKTGRDGIGGATGSSKIHTTSSIDSASSEVQKGNALEERKIQRLFRNSQVSKLIKKANDFGAGGISVAVGELADGIIIDLNKVPTKYLGINGTELAISESQERMAVVISKDNKDEFINLCHKENLEAVQIATIIEDKKLIMKWNNVEICNISREFIDTSGIRQKTSIKVNTPIINNPFESKYKDKDLKEKIKETLQDKNVASQQGLVEMFDSTIGRTTVLMPYGGKYQLTKTQVSVNKIPVLGKKTSTVSIMSYGFNPYISEWSPYHGATFAVIESISKIVASGGNYKNVKFTFQEYFERLNKNPHKWSKPFSALLGAMNTLEEFELAAIGGKDSMSGTYNDISVPPTLVSFAVTTTNIDRIISPEFKKAGNHLYLINHNLNEIKLPNVDKLKENYDFITQSIANKKIVSAYALEHGGLLEAIIKSSFGNKIGVQIETNIELDTYNYGAILVESTELIDYQNAIYLGETIDSEEIIINMMSIEIDKCIEYNQARYRDIYPIIHQDERILENQNNNRKSYVKPNINVEQVKVFIPVFPGTNCEYDTISAFEEAKAKAIPFVFNNQSEADIDRSIDEMVKHIDESHIIMLSGGFSSGDEPDGSGKFIANVLRNKKIAAAIKRFLKKKHLILGVCNGFQALVKSGLLPYGKIKSPQEDDPTLFKNSINRHISKFVNTKVASVSSPWLSSFNKGDVHTIAVSHGEGKFIVNQEEYLKLVNNNQIVFQYVDELDNPTYNALFNPNGSSYAIEGIISEDGLILGKMGHSERYQEGLFKNIHGNKEQNIFKNAVKYFQE